MPFHPESEQPDFSSLVTSLDNSKLQTSNYALYQTIFYLIKNVIKSKQITIDTIKKMDEDISVVFAGSFLTVNDESIKFINSRQLLAGIGVLFDDTVPHKRTINVISGPGTYYDSPLSDGDLVAASLIFGNGDPIICQVPNT